MKKGEINADSIPISEKIKITAPVEVVIKKGEFTVTELWVDGKPIPHFRGFANVLLEKQREFAQKQKALTDW